ncbi:MAG TPA: UbiA family prenyltransferase, partial [Candidatus Binatus sp.]|nr:UbiA family prenyltransferase [Candidatus Binatus sp.]
MATLLLAALAGGSSTVALRLAGSMLALQISIGALNDLVDADLDRGRKPGKPIPRGVVTTSEAAMVAIIGLAVGLALSAPSGAPTVLVAAAGAGCGYAYDLRLSRTGWSWLPLAAALPLVPLYAWLGATGTLPGELVAIMPAGLLAGAALALANGLADLERDRAAGTAAAVVRIGPTPAWALHTTALGGAVVIA